MTRELSTNRRPLSRDDEPMPLQLPIAVPPLPSREQQDPEAGDEPRRSSVIVIDLA